MGVATMPLVTMHGRDATMQLAPARVHSRRGAIAATVLEELPLRLWQRGKLGFTINVSPPKEYDTLFLCELGI